LDTLLQAIEKAGYKPGDDVMIALDCASSEFYKDGSMITENSRLRMRSVYKQRAGFLLSRIGNKYPIISIEDGMQENDWEGWKMLTDKIGDRVQLVGDDLFVTNVERLSRGVKEGIANSIL
jgi:enolase